MESEAATPEPQTKEDSDSPGDTPEVTDAPVVAEPAQELPAAEAGADVPTEAPGDQPSEAPGDQLSEAPGDSVQPSEVPADTPIPEAEESLLSEISHGDSSRAADDEVAALTGIGGESEDSITVQADTTSDKPEDTTLVADTPLSSVEAGEAPAPADITTGSLGDLQPVETSTPAPDRPVEAATPGAETPAETRTPGPDQVGESAKEAMDRDEEKDISVRTSCPGTEQGTSSPGKVGDKLKGSDEHLSGSASDDSQDTVRRSDVETTNIDDEQGDTAENPAQPGGAYDKKPFPPQQFPPQQPEMSDAKIQADSEISSVLPEPVGLDSTMDSVSDVGTADGVEDIETDSEQYDVYPPRIPAVPFGHSSVMGRDVGQALNRANMQFYRMEEQYPEDGRLDMSSLRSPQRPRPPAREPMYPEDGRLDMSSLRTPQRPRPPARELPQVTREYTNDEGEVIIDVLELGVSDSDESERLLLSADPGCNTGRSQASYGQASTDSNSTDQLIHSEPSGRKAQVQQRNETISDYENVSMFSQNKSDSGAYFSDDYRPVQQVRPNNYFQERYGQPHSKYNRKQWQDEDNNSIDEEKQSHININPPPHININPKIEGPPPKTIQEPVKQQVPTEIRFMLEDDVYDEDLRAMRAFLEEKVVPKMEFRAKSVDLTALADSPYAKKTIQQPDISNDEGVSDGSDGSTIDGDETCDSEDSQSQGVEASDRDGGVTPQPRLKRLEDTVLRDTDDQPSLRGDEEGSPPTKVPAKIREIITKNLNTDESTLPEPGTMSAPNMDQVREENRMLQSELNRVEDLLANSRAERDEIGIKYNALSERLESALKSGGGGEISSSVDPSAQSLVQQNIELRRKLEDEHSGYKRKLQAYQDGQQRQAQLVQKLQAKVLQYKRKVGDLEEDNKQMKEKVLQYKRKCGELEETVRSQQSEADRYRKSLHSTQDSLANRLESTEARLRLAEADHTMDLETALIKLEEEQQRSASLAHVNTMLREQLDQATSANQALTADIHKLTQDWQRAREELEAKENEWREEEQSFNEYFSAEHSRLLSLWRAVVAFRRQFQDMKTSTERDLSHVRADVSRAARSMHSACLNLSANNRNQETQAQFSVDRERSERVTVESQLRDKVREAIDIQAKYDAQASEYSARINELTVLNEKLKLQLGEKDKSYASLQRTVATLESRISVDQDAEKGALEEYDKAEREEIDAMHEALRRIAQEVINDCDQSLMDDQAGDPELSTSVVRPSSPIRAASMSPVRAGRRTPSPRRGASPRRHASRSGSRSPTRLRSPGFADSTYSAVQAALHKRQLQVSELRAKLTASRDQGAGLRKQLDLAEDDRRKGEQVLINVKEERDNAVRAQQDANRGQDRLKNSLDVTSSEKSQLERVRNALNEQIEALNTESAKLQAANSELQRQRDQLEDEKEDTIKDKERQVKENDRCHKVIEQCESKISKLKEELVNTKECLNRTCLEKDVLDQEKAEISDALSKNELMKAELELDINKVKTEEASLRDALLKMQALNEGLGQDKIELNKIIMQMEAERGALLGEKAAVEQEKCGLKDELIRVEQEKMDVETEKQGIKQTLALTEQTGERLEDEIMMLNRERAEVTEQLSTVSRQKAALAEELIASRKEVERQSDTIVRIAKEKEALTRDKAQLTVELTASERENRQQSEVISSLKSDKDALETALYEAQQLCANLETRKEQLEGENQELILKKEHLNAEIARTRKEMEVAVEKLERAKDAVSQKLAQTEKDLQLALKQEQQAHEEDIERMSREKEAQRNELEGQREDILHSHNMEKEELVGRYENEKEDLANEIVALQRERDEQLLMAENDRQQVMSLAEQEKSTLQEKLANLQLDLANANNEYDRLKRDALAKQEADRATINNQNAELKNFRQQFDEACAAHEREVKQLNEAINDLQRQKEAALREVAELKVQLKMVEETRDTIRRDLIEANRKIREGEELRELMRKENLDLKRNVNEEVQEKEAVTKTAHDLRNMVKKVEAEKVDLNRIIADAKQKIGVLEEQKAGVQKEAGDLRASLREVEKARLDARRELQELRRQVKMLDSERNKLGSEVNELQNRVARDEEKEEEARKENFGLKQRVVETEASREALRKELANLQRKMAELEDESRLKEKDLILALEDSRRGEKKTADQAHNLEISLEHTNAEMADLKLRLSGAEGRVNALEAQLARIEGAKRDVEFKLSSIHSSLRRTIGFRQDMPRARSPSPRHRSISPRRSRPNSPTKGFENTFTTTTDGRGSPIPRTGSPDRSRSPYRAMSPSRLEVAIADIDPEAVRCALRDFVQQLAGAERERDDAIASMKSMSVQLKDMEEDRDRLDMRLQQLQRSLGEAEEGKRDIDSRLASAQTALMLQEETIRRNERERKQMSDKISNLERNLTAAESDRKQNQEKLAKMKANEAKLEEDRKSLRLNLDDAENRVTKGELARRALEGDLQRMKLAMSDKETENQVLCERVDAMNRNVQDLETKGQSLQLTIDRLSMALAKTEEEESNQKAKVQQLNLSLSDGSATIADLQERLQQLQRALTSSEHDRRVLQERLDTTRTALNEAKKQNHSLMERVQSLQNELGDSEVRRSELEGQIRQSHTMIVQRQEAEQEVNQKLQKSLTEKQALGERVAALQRTLSNLETEKREAERSAVRMDKDRSALKKTLDKVEREKLRSEEALTRTVTDRSSLDKTLGRLEEDNIELQRQVQGLQGTLAAAEQEHSQRLIDLTTRHRQETELETERLRSAQLQAERLLEARERAHRQRVKGLEEQCSTLKDQLGQEMRKRQQYISRGVRVGGDDMNDLRNLLDTSLTKVAHDPDLDPILLEAESKKLDDVIDYHRSMTPTRISPRRRSPGRTHSPVRLGRSPVGRTPPTSLRRSSPSPAYRSSYRK